ncbi:hypothetical protein SAY87_021702 [Trapa incisa]|uniref:GTD-binding domain-containing protein n=1 Tax=Trapa incisa TaxID=236973 RepID=A0AAN7JSB5_9MYRT|nr:hypothetical protein SAY87_021702 [Trapa incisa]
MAKRSFKSFVEQELGKFPLFMIYAVLEWILMAVLFLDGFLAFLANEFAKFFEMPLPCLLCTRIDHVLVKRNLDFYYNESMCESHKKEVSSLAYCHVHKKLSDIQKMCEACLLSFATEKDSDCDTYKSLVGILHKDFDCSVQDDPNIQLSLQTSRKLTDEDTPSDHNRCSCCGEPLRVMFSSSNLKGGGVSQRPKRSTSPISQAPAPSPRWTFMPASRGGDGPNPLLSHIRCNQLKFMSDGGNTENQEDDTLNEIVPENQGKEDAKAASVPLLADAEEITEPLRTPTFLRGNKFFGIPLSDSVNSSPRWFVRPSRRSPLEKTEFASQDTADQNTASNDPENFAIVNHLKRQVKLDRNSLMDLYMELDEERSASAVAANNAMAMITRLQAEKSAVQMEALQYQRMMEEQAEYDQEALQEMSNMLTKREEEMKALEAEVEVFRKKFGCLKGEDLDLCKIDVDEEENKNTEPRSCSFLNEGSECDSVASSEHSRRPKDQSPEDTGELIN